MKLFVIYIGGSTTKSLIELHDIRFVIANSIEETYDTIRKNWWGTPESLHLDAWGELTYADGFEITIQPKSTTAPSHDKLYFLNLGGYDNKQFTELHHNTFVVAPDKKSAKIKAKAQIQHWEVPHTDSNLEVENVFSVGECLENSEFELMLTKTSKTKPFVFTCRYTPIGLPAKTTLG